MLHAVWMLMAAPASADGSSGGRPGDESWVPSLAVVLGFTTQEHDGSVSSCRFAIFSCNQPARPSDTNSKNLTLLHVGGSLEVETPVLPVPGLRPRLIFGAEVEHASSQRRSIAREADPRPELIYPVPDPENFDFPDSAILGQGSATTSDAETLQYGAMIGFSIPVDIGDWQFNIKPSARYIHQEYTFRGIFSEADRAGDLDAPPPTSVTLLQGSEKLDVHAVGPHMELEVLATQIESFGASVFVNGGAYRVLSDRDVSFMAQGRDNLNTRTFQAFWSAEIDPWIYRAGVGMRVRWLGAKGGWLFTGD